MVAAARGATSCVVAPPADRVRFLPGALACAGSCFARVRPCAQGRCSRCPPGPSMMSLMCVWCFFFLAHYRVMHETGGSEDGLWLVMRYTRGPACDNLNTHSAAPTMPPVVLPLNPIPVWWVEWPPAVAPSQPQHTPCACSNIHVAPHRDQPMAMQSCCVYIRCSGSDTRLFARRRQLSHGQEGVGHACTCLYKGLHVYIKDYMFV